MKARISALMDGDLGAGETETVLAALRHEGEAFEAWRTYHLIGDAMRDSRSLSPDFSARVAERVAREPTVLAPAAAPAPATPRARWGVMPVAASVAAVALVSWLALVPQQPPQAPVPMAQPAPAVLAQKAPAPPAAAPKPADLARVPLPAATDDYLLAHQRYSPRHALQGVAPYVRAVSADSGVRKP
jgi:sigma-E factor negative regulatory protein RseA